MKPSTRLFCCYVKVVARCHGVKVNYIDKPYIDYRGGGIAGYFDDLPPTLVVATGIAEQEWLEILVHEYCHMMQWVKQVPAWTECYINKDECGRLLDDWLEGGELSVGDISQVIQKVRAVELDCESRALKLIKSFRLSIDCKRYAKKANAYMYHYTVTQRLRKWNKPGCASYKSERILAHMSDMLLTESEYANMDQELFELFKKECHYET